MMEGPHNITPAYCSHRADRQSRVMETITSHVVYEQSKKKFIAEVGDSRD